MDTIELQESFHFGTKAQTLARLKPLLVEAEVLDLIFFIVEEWQQSRDHILQNIETKFHGKKLAIRSSALVEDSHDRSLAGAFTSCLNIDGKDPVAICRAIDTVCSSFESNPHNQILVQVMLDDIAVSGVITTHVLNDGAPYYVLNYDDESGKTDTITGGIGVNKTVLIYRDSDPVLIESERVARWLEFTKELELICGNVALDIEFAQTHTGRLYLLQVRQIAIEKKWSRTINQRITNAQVYIKQFIKERSRQRPGIVGSYTILGEMPDWNPAEIIGMSPRPLAASLYQYLITDEVWRKAREQMGYRHSKNERLMVLIGGRPYIDVRNSFNSFLPAQIDDEIGHKLVDACLDRLNKHPEFHDKIEFQVIQTVMDFKFEETFEKRYANTLTYQQKEMYKTQLQVITRRALNTEHGSLPWALQSIKALESHQRQRNVLNENFDDSPDCLICLKNLLDECKYLGTLPFSIIARHAFIAEILLRSAVERGGIQPERLDAFKQSMVTVMGIMFKDMERVCNNDLDKPIFIKKYGHLRPGTYDILSLRYDQRDDLFLNYSLPKHSRQYTKFSLTDTERRSLQGYLLEAGLDHCTPEYLLQYANTAIVGREYAKFVFSKNLSDALELIAEWGHRNGLTRDDMSFVPLQSILENLYLPILEDHKHHFRRIADRGRKSIEITHSLRLGYIIRDIRDIYIVPLHRSAPNFTTQKCIEARIAIVDSHMMHFPDLFGKIVCIENADPGFDWIFTQGISGLITKFGGSNSHMAIRCAELNLPAAIGCGEQIFERLVEAGYVELNCAAKIVRPIHG